MPDHPLRALSAILFFPRGGSAYVTRALARGQQALGDRVTILSGSRSDNATADATRFYSGLDVHAVDFAPALATAAPMRFAAPAGQAPMHPSFEDRSDAPDGVFAAVDDETYELQLRTWARELERAGARERDVLHLHHLTPLNAAVERVAPGVPVVGHLHGTELLMLERIESGPVPDGWDYAAKWARRMSRWADACRLLLVAPGGTARAADLLGVPVERLHELPNGFDPEVFRRRTVDRMQVWRRCLVDRPRGWLPDGKEGSIAYQESDLEAFAHGPVLLYCGRFTAVKRIDLLIVAYARARERLDVRAPLVIVGGHPGEWEGEHPAQTVARLGVPDVFLAGWHDQSELPELLSAADLMAMPSAREQFGQVLVEAMACEVPVIAASSPGPASIVEDGRTGWLVAVDDERALTEAIVKAIGDEDERARRARLAHERALENYSWDALAVELHELMLEVRGARAAGGAGERTLAPSPAEPAGTS